MKEPEISPEREELSRVQRWFQAVMTHAEGVEAGVDSEVAQKLMPLPRGEIERILTRSQALTATERLAIYAQAYHSRLLECLGEVFPMLQRTLGEEAFDGLAFGYLQDYPSRSYTLNELGRHFPTYLAETRPSAEETETRLADVRPSPGEPGLSGDWPIFLIDLARLEWAIYEVFDGLGVEGDSLLNKEQLAQIGPEHWPQMKLKPVVCLRLLKTRFPVNDYYTALRRARAEDAMGMPQPAASFLALTRRDFVVRRFNLSQIEYELLEALQQGHSVGQAVESIATSGDADLDQLAANLQNWFRDWTLAGFFHSAH